MTPRTVGAEGDAERGVLEDEPVLRELIQCLDRIWNDDLIGQLI